MERVGSPVVGDRGPRRHLHRLHKRRVPGGERPAVVSEVVTRAGRRQGDLGKHGSREAADRRGHIVQVPGRLGRRRDLEDERLDQVRNARDLRVRSERNLDRRVRVACAGSLDLVDDVGVAGRTRTHSCPARLRTEVREVLHVEPVAPRILQPGQIPAVSSAPQVVLVVVPDVVEPRHVPGKDEAVAVFVPHLVARGSADVVQVEAAGIRRLVIVADRSPN